MSAGSAKNSPKPYVVHLQKKHLPNSIGNKAANLRRLKDKKFRIPDSYVCTWEAYTDYLSSEGQAIKKLRLELVPIIDPGKSYAVRSSANLEDDLEHSFAGQFSTILDVEGIEGILLAIQEIWDNTRTEGVYTYLEKKTASRHELKMAVLIQEMIEPVVSGVVFSKNPITSLDEVLIEAVLGSGISLVQKGVTPLRWIYKWGNWTLKPENSPVPIELVLRVVEGTKEISRAFKKAVDLEWVFDGQELYWVQLRDITSINKENIYSNRMAKEMSPGQIKPLVWSVSIPVPAQAWVKLIAEITGKADIQAEKLVRAFHYRAYYNMGVFGDIFASLGLPRESLEMMMGLTSPGAGKPPMKPSPKMISLTPRLLRFVKDKWNFGKRFDENFPYIYDRAHQFSIHPAGELDDRQILKIIDRIMALNREITYYTVVNILLMQAYNAMLRSRLKKIGVDLQQFDLTEDLPELDQYHPGNYLRELNQQFQALGPEQKIVFRQGNYETFLKMGGITPLQEQVDGFFDLFGHLSDTTSNFSSIPWRETPGLILQLIADYQPPADGATRIRYADLPKTNWRLSLSYQRARQFYLYREKSSSLYTYILMLARAYYLALADRMVEKGIIAERENIFYLYDSEIRAYLEGEMTGDQLRPLPCQRKLEMEQSKDAILPEVIFGDEIPLMIAASADKLSGTPTSKGYYMGTTRIVQGIQDFSKLTQGDVLVIPYSDAGWTPLFAKAGAVIAESGGILSHSSIIAREYNIPAVVSVAGALQLTDGILVTVDGFKGEILIHPGAPQPTDQMIPEEILECSEE